MNRKYIILAQVKTVLSKYVKTGKVFIFGSQANANELTLADIDVGFESIEPISFKTYLKIKAELETIPTLFKFDLVDFSKVTNQFKQTAYRNIELI